MKITMLLLIGSMILLFPFSRAAAQEVAVDAITTGVEFQASGDLILRADAASGGLFYQKADNVGTIQKGEKLVVLDTKIVKTIFNEQKWIRVEREKGEPRQGWIYVGDSGDTINFLQIQKRRDVK